MKNILIIDSGINKNVRPLEDYVIKSVLFNMNCRGEINKYIKSEPHHIHGTYIAKIITQFNLNIQITDYNILDNNLQTDGRVLLYALEQAIDEYPDIIHMSLGTTNPRYILKMQRLILIAKKRGILIVAAKKNGKGISFPADLFGVVRVKANNDLIKKQIHKSGLVYYANGNPFEILNNENVCGNSIAAAYVTGFFSLRQNY